MSEHDPRREPEIRWEFAEEKRRGPRVALITALILAVLVVVAVLVFFLIPRGGDTPAPTDSPSASASATPTTSPSPTATTPPSPTPTSEPTTPPAPPVPDPELGVFRDKVTPRLTDADTGLTMIASASGEEARQFVDQLQEDAQRLAGAVPPSSIADAWHSALGTYADSLSQLRSAAASGDASGAVDGARQALNGLVALLG
ncbi:hypothetical protein GCM10025768_10610 [Microbacterium pseudoresistens]|uniref:Cytoskeletal protein RodZ n=1 Tax=Microbacterium pseudoresistens TaxID=640634 RepID=A0A7Y9EW88_9MICO|nr:hypothetical protein [Microbacterium pseudoresistens]NYD54964.1 cytoskeletal protein RodZ [Microbacterium pseudoresistens]